MQSVIQRSQELSNEQLVEQFRTNLTSSSASYSVDEQTALANLFAKTPTDNYVVYSKADLVRPLKQGDILLYHTSSSYYKAVSKTIGSLRKSNGMNLQDGVSVTGDHRCIAVEGSKFSIEEGMFKPKDNITRGRQYPCKVIKSDKPFLIYHSEHGNITVPEGEYLAFTAINPETLTRVLD